MKLQGVLIDILRAVRRIQSENGVDPVNEVDVADLLGLNVQFVRSRLDALARAGYVRFERMYPCYSVRLTPRVRELHLGQASGRGSVSETW